MLGFPLGSDEEAIADGLFVGCWLGFGLGPSEGANVGYCDEIGHGTPQVFGHLRNTSSSCSSVIRLLNVSQSHPRIV